jgi:hypothetical protein
MADMEGNEGMSTRKKVAAGAALGVAVPAAVAVGKKLLGNGDDDSGSQKQPGSGGSSGLRSRSGSTRSRSSSSGTRSRSSGTKRSTGSRRRSSGSSSQSGGSPRGDNRTKEQLYNQAKRLGIEGRSSMTKAQLERAISRKRA